MNHRTVTSYSRGSKWLHWLVAIPVIFMLIGSFFLDEVPEQYQSAAYMIHKSVGLTILGLMVVRLFWMMYAGKPALPAFVPDWEKYLSKFVQYGFYVFLFAQTVCGWIMSVAAGRTPTFFGLFEVPFYGIAVDKDLSHCLEEVHTTIAWILIALVVLHVLGALKHYFVDKDQIMNRML